MYFQEYGYFRFHGYVGTWVLPERLNRLFLLKVYFKIYRRSVFHRLCTYYFKAINKLKVGMNYFYKTTPTHTASVWVMDPRPSNHHEGLQHELVQTIGSRLVFSLR